MSISLTEKRNEYATAIFLILVFFVGLGLHFFRIDYPDRPVFDEAHFATYSADYLTGHVFDDVHPPLGKLIYSSVLSFYPGSDLANSQFSTITKAPNGTLTVVADDIPYGNFPYVALRVVSALFGTLLPIVFYFLMSNIGAGRIVSSLAALFVLFDNALLLSTRLILMDGMFILFGLVALALYFNRQRFVRAGGLVWGLALAVKLTAIVFAGPLIAAYILARGKQEKKIELKRIIRFAALGFAVLFMVALAGSFSFPTSARLNELSLVGFLNKGAVQLTPQWQEAHPVHAYFLADAGEIAFSGINYILGNPHDAESPWYFWPAMQSPIFFYVPPVVAGSGSGGAGQSGGDLVLTGNLILWLASTLAVFVAIAVSLRHAREHYKESTDHRAFFVLFAGYLFSMVPFILFIHRSTFLYHYFPALIFAFGLLAWFIGHRLNLKDWSDLSRRQVFILSMILVVVVIGFLAAAPFTYGL